MGVCPHVEVDVHVQEEEGGDRGVCVWELQVLFYGGQGPEKKVKHISPSDGSQSGACDSRMHMDFVSFPGQGLVGAHVTCV